MVFSKYLFDLSFVLIILNSFLASSKAQIEGIKSGVNGQRESFAGKG